ncbi:MAG: biotin--[Lachnospiraceae bacterium]|nr:biotin--[acetyl-CoA-carboxylase] ligase [Lachnospiraceae bacterium]
MKQDRLSEKDIRSFLNKEYQEIPICVYEETTSTNLLAKEAAQKIDGTVLFVAERQTAGRGRRGRSFLTVPGEMILMSLLLKPKLQAADAVLLTTAVCVAVRRAIEQVCGISTEIKWVNDLYYRGKKVCGILTEAVTAQESGRVECVIPGIGINFNMPPDAFPEELREIAGALYDDGAAVSRNELVAEIVNQIFAVLQDLQERSFMEDYRKHSMLIGQQIRIMNEPPEEALVLDVNQNGGLVVQLTDGSCKTLTTGEVTVRKI